MSSYSSGRDSQFRHARQINQLVVKIRRRLNERSYGFAGLENFAAGDNACPDKDRAHVIVGEVRVEGHNDCGVKPRVICGQLRLKASLNFNPVRNFHRCIVRRFTLR